MDLVETYSNWGLKRPQSHPWEQGGLWIILGWNDVTCGSWSLEDLTPVRKIFIDLTKKKNNSPVVLAESGESGDGGSLHCNVEPFY